MHSSLVDPVQRQFIEMFNQPPLMVFAPGRINLIGEHTDYNEGFVMPAAIHLGIVVGISPTDQPKSRIYAYNFGQMIEVDLSCLEPIKSPDWGNYLLGVLKSFTDISLPVKPFNCVFGGNIPIGAGLSSSAALECGFAFALNELFNLKVKKMDLMRMAQWAEHNYAGVKCGIMDQFTSLMGRSDHALFLDCRSLDYQYLPIHVGDYQILICDTNVKHELSNSEFNTRKHECEQGVQILKKENPRIRTLRDATVEMIHKYRRKMHDTIYRRCLYVIEENDRVQEAARYLREGDLKALGSKMNQTHTGLSTQYEVSCDELDFLVNQAHTKDYIIGSRMMGGGFGGCTINIIHNDGIEPFLKEVIPKYRNRFKRNMEVHRVQICDGAHVVR